MTYGELKNIINLFDTMGVNDNTPLYIFTDETKSCNNQDRELLFNVPEMVNGLPTCIEVIIKDVTQYEKK